MHLKHHFAICLATAFLFIGHSQVKAQNVAQTSLEESSSFYRAMEIVQSQQQLNTQQRPTDIKMRVIGVSANDTTKIIYHYGYLPGTSRGFKPDFYAEFFSLNFSLSPEVHFENPKGITPFFHRNQIRADTIYQNDNNGVKKIHTLGFYNNNDNLDSIHVYMFPKDEIRNKFYLKYGDSGEIRQHYLHLTDTISQTYTVYDYDSRQRLITDTLFFIYPMPPNSTTANTAHIYNYNNKGLIDTILEYRGPQRNFSLSGRLFLEYNADDQVIKMTEYNNTVLGGQDTIYHDFTYRKPGDVVYQTYNKLKLTSGNLPSSNTFRYYHFGSNDLPDSFNSWSTNILSTQTYDTNYVIRLFKYDKMNNLTHFYQTIKPNEKPVLMQRLWYKTFNSGISEKSIQSSAIRIAPNPFHNYLDVYAEKDDAETRIELIDISGRKVFQNKVYLQSGRNRISVPDHISNGIYFLRIEQQNKTLFSGQVLKE